MSASVCSSIVATLAHFFQAATGSLSGSPARASRADERREQAMSIAGNGTAEAPCSPPGTAEIAKA